MSTIAGLFASSGVLTKDTKVVETVARSVRLVCYPDGTEKMQGAYQWTQGFKGGIEWRDLPVIPVGSNGQEFDED